MYKRKIFIVLFITNFIMACSHEDTGKIDKPSSVMQNNGNKENTNHTLADSEKMLDQAISSLNNVAEEFHWRDTHLIIQESRNAIKLGDFELSIKLSKNIIQQSNLMNEQHEFSNNNWQKLIPLMDNQ